MMINCRVWKIWNQFHSCWWSFCALYGCNVQLQSYWAFTKHRCRCKCFWFVCPVNAVMMLSGLVCLCVHFVMAQL